jgi:hypothetical protein
MGISLVFVQLEPHVKSVVSTKSDVQLVQEVTDPAHVTHEGSQAYQSGPTSIVLSTSHEDWHVLSRKSRLLFDVQDVQVVVEILHVLQFGSQLSQVLVTVFLIVVSAVQSVLHVLLSKNLYEDDESHDVQKNALSLHVKQCALTVSQFSHLFVVEFP